MQNESGFTPNGDLVLILPPEVQKKSSGGILFPEQVVEKEAQATRLGRVVAMGDEAASDPRMKGVRVGSMVLYPRYCMDFLPVDGVRYIILRANAILGPMTKLPDYQIGYAKSSMEVFDAAA